MENGSKKPGRLPSWLAWVATLLTFGAAVAFQMNHARFVPIEQPNDQLKVAEHVVEAGVTAVWTLALALTLLTVRDGDEDGESGAEASAWLAACGLLIWAAGLLGFVVHGAGNAAAS